MFESLAAPAALPAYTPLQWAVVAAFPAAMLAAAVSDAATMRIPNWLTGSLALIFPVAAAGIAMPLENLGLSLAAGAGALVVGMILFALGWVGGGDAKLFAATSLWLGPAALAAYAIAAALIGGILTIALIMFRRLPLPAPLAGQAWLARLHDPGEGVPYGMALAAAGLWAFAGTPWLAGAA